VGNVYRPTSLLVVLNDELVCAFTSLTSAAAITAFCWSVTWPTTDPVAVCAVAGAALQQK
jgi:hypothetical protein